MFSHPANDNDTYEPDALWPVDLLLMIAGFDPERTPIRRRVIALAIARALAGFDCEEEDDRKIVIRSVHQTPSRRQTLQQERNEP